MRAQSFDAQLKKIAAEAKEHTERIAEESERRRQTWTQEQWDASARQREKDAKDEKETEEVRKKRERQGSQ
jgi:hypothetical protein